MTELPTCWGCGRTLHQGHECEKVREARRNTVTAKGTAKNEGESTDAR